MVKQSKQYILLPEGSLFASSHEQSRSLIDPKANVELLGLPSGTPVEVLDSVAESGPKLVELDDAGARAINSSPRPVRAAPVVEYSHPTPPEPKGEVITAAAPQPTNFTVRVLDETGQAGLAGVYVAIWTDVLANYGKAGYTDANGELAVSLHANDVERVAAYSIPGYWGVYEQGPLAVPGSVDVQLIPVDLRVPDSVRDAYANSTFDPQAGVRVGVLDTGVGPHKDLALVGGLNTVAGEQPNLVTDGRMHGTHVAGLIGAGGTPPQGIRGVAPGVEIAPYRVFPAGKGGATNFAILKAMIHAQMNGCDILNLSLGGGPWDPIVEDAVRDARDNGLLVVVAAGNGGRRPVEYPAAYPGATAVSAMGVVGSYPSGTTPELDEDWPPFGNDPKEYIAGFSNVGHQISCTGLGVGVLSTLPNDLYGPMSGTSMASPVVAGAAACLLSQKPAILGLPRGRGRSDAIERLMTSSCVSRGVGMNHEGYGQPQC